MAAQTTNLPISQQDYPSWEEALTQEIEAYDVCRSDAQGIVEAHEQQARQLFASGKTPQEAGRVLMN